MRLNNYQRRDVVTRAVAARFDKLDEDMKKAEHDLGMRFYKKVIPETERRAVAKLSKRWIAKDSCLRFNVGGPNLQFDINEAVAVPANGGYCKPLGALEGEDVDAARAHHDRLDELRQQRKDATCQLKALLDSIGSFKQLEEVWPEGKPFYQHLGSDERLPMPIVNDVNKMLGLAA